MMVMVEKMVVKTVPRCKVNVGTMVVAVICSNGLAKQVVVGMTDSVAEATTVMLHRLCRALHVLRLSAFSMVAL